MPISLNRRTLFQVVFWIFIASINFLFASNIMSTPSAFLAGSVITLFLMATFYLNTLWIFPSYFGTDSRIHYFWVSMAMIIIVSVVQVLVEVFLMGPFIDLVRGDFEIPILFVAIRTLVWHSLVYIISLVFLFQERLAQEMTYKKKLAEEKLDAELELLKNQIQPHFIFNALNNIYSLAYRKAEETPESILKLSEMLRYVLEDNNRDKVQLREEVEYIENYISFKKMKSPHDENIVFDYKDADLSIRLAPMLIIPFIENSFKYSRIEEFPNAYIHIELATRDQQIIFKLKNSVPSGGGAKSGSGLGIKNVQKRLDILYPDKHELEIQQKKEFFKVELKLASNG